MNALAPCPELELPRRPARRVLALLLCLPLEGAGLWAVLHLLDRHGIPVPPVAPRIVTVSLAWPAETRVVPLVLPPGPRGGSSGGTGTRDASLPAAPLGHGRPATGMDPLEPLVAPPGLVNAALPVAPGGNGLPQGKGHGYGTGEGDGTGAGVRVPRLLHVVHPRHDCKGSPLLLGRVVVVLTVDGQGIPTKAVPVEGHPDLVQTACRATLQWRFEPPAACGQKVPWVVQVTVDFQPEA